jgi:hypothetical protein
MQENIVKEFHIYLDINNMERIDIDDLLTGLKQTNCDGYSNVDYIDVVMLIRDLENKFIEDKIQLLQNLRSKINPYTREGGSIKLDIEIEIYELKKLLNNE